jgi:hypothetical protein
MKQTNIHFLSHVAHFLELTMFLTKVVEKTDILIQQMLFYENNVIYEIMCKNVVERGRLQITEIQTHTQNM